MATTAPNSASARAAFLPGLALALTIALAARYASDFLGSAIFNLGKSPVSPIMLAVLAGVALRSFVGMHTRLERGVAMASGIVLRTGLALVGLRLTLSGMGVLGLRALPVVAGCLTVAWLVIPRLARAFGLRGGLVTLLTVGTSICGCTAIMAIAPVIRARVEEIGYAVTIVVIVGLCGMLLYPSIAHALFANDPRAAGIFLGSSIHDTSQVIGAALLYSGQYASPETLEAATVTKLLRNLTLVAVVPALAALQEREAGTTTARRSAVKLVPGFVIAFVLMAVLRTAGDFLGGDIPAFTAAWNPGLDLANHASELLLTIGMAAVGLTVELRGLRQVGWQPLGAGLLAAVMTAGVSLTLVTLLA